MSELVPYQRPGYGSKGRKAVFHVNYFELKKYPKADKWIKYAVEIKKPFIPAEGAEGAEGASDPRSDARREPKPPKVEIKRKVFKELEKKKGNELFQNVSYIFDGERTLYTDKRINMKTNVFNSSVLLNDEQDLRGKPSEFLVQILELQDPLDLNELHTYVQAKSFRWDYFNMESLKALNDLMHTSPSSRYFQFRDLILDPNTRRSLGGGFELWAGFFESVRPGQESFFVNVNRTHTVFYERKDLVTFLCEFLGLRDLPATFNTEQQKKINRALTGLKVRPLHRPNIKTKQSVWRISQKKAVEHTFTLRDTGKITNVKEYFKDVYKIALKSPHVVEIQARKTEVWPLECCEIVEGQRVKLTNLNGDQLAKMITFTAVLPKLNMDTILKEGIGRVLDFTNDKKLDDFGVVVDTQMAVTPGRILDPPMIAYHSSSKDGPKLKPNNGGWNLRGRKFIKSGIPLKYWFVICCVQDRYLPRVAVEDFVVTLVNTCRGQGMEIVMDQPEIIYVNTNGDFKETIKREYHNSRKFLPNKPQMILFLLPPEVQRRKRQMFPRPVYDRPLNQSLYRDIKFTTSTVLGLPSQCIVADNIQEGPSYCANVALKMNLKLGGTNSILDTAEIPELTKEPVMLLGADVTHPTGENSEDFPSICSVVASVDQHGSRYIDRHYDQKRTKEDSKGFTKTVSDEEIKEMQQIAKDLLTEYKQKNRFLPKKIIMYRDGVSESQYKMVLERELKAIKDACKDFKDIDGKTKKEKTYDPPITFIIVGKRHHVRANAEDRRNTDKNGNCVPGTIIDQKITHPYLFDFYLYSHSSLQGTSRPAHYIILYDENKFNVDTLQNFTYKLCYNYQRATRSVSIPPPVYYAHLSAKHARTNVLRNKDNTYEFRQVLPSLAQNFPMYFM
ncbi:2182_t:CDS:1 [Ambispora gerdemannii]|uniref:2182_t:CDS:1 n=1 Tax=Ambispora gerdemannii TaxID=144530 RepID=A0A9N9CQQ8_9GLOM|nr:2182_t:CDS:1 [Ambispora gerdemannii]